MGDGESLDEGIDTLLSDVEGLLDDRTDHSQRGKTAMKVATQDKSRVFSSLKEMEAPKELQEATALLMSSCLLDESTAMLLTRDIMDLTAKNSSAAGSNDGQEEDYDTSHKDNIRLQEEAKQDNTEVITSKESDETMSLLKASVNEDMLQPSIWNIHKDDEKVA